MGVFVVILAAMGIGDVAWWMWAHRRLGRTRRPRVWRLLLGSFMGLMLGYLLWHLMFPSAARHAHQWMPAWALATVYIWHVFVLPITLVFVLVDAIVGLARGLAHRDPPRSRASQVLDRVSGAMVGP